MKVKHTLDPIYDNNSKVLILGSMPSVKSREIGFYYAHPRNRFWSVLKKIYNENNLETIDDKINFLHSHHIALFDVIESCDIDSSKDSSIKNIVVNDLSQILNNSQIKVIFTTGKTAYNLYNKYTYPKTNIKAIYLPSTSPANSPKGIDELLEKEYSKIKEYTDL